MTTTIIIDHPWKESFNHALLNELVTNFERENKEYHVIDLYQDQFNPVMQTEELAVYQSGVSKDPLINKYIDILKETTQLVLIFPIWWYSSPAGLKGFFDKILLNNVAFCDGENGIEPLLNIHSTVVFTTSEQKTEDLIKRCGDSFKNQIATTLTDVGFNAPAWYHLGYISNLTQAERVAFLEKGYSRVNEV